MESYRQIEGEIRLLQKQNDFLYDVEIWMLSASDNRNNWRYPVNDKVASLFLGKPLLTAYVMGGKIVGDGHNFRETVDPETGEPRGDFTGADAERIVGSLSEDQKDIRVVERDGDTWIVGRGTLWEWYCGQLCQQIRQLAEQGRTMPVSIETLVTESHMDGDIEVMDEFIVLGVTILGVHVAPAVAGARITALQALEGQFKELKIRAASYAGAGPADPQEPKEDPEGGGEKTPKMNQKGVNKTLILTKKQLQELNARFAGYVLLRAKKDEESGEVTIKMRNDAYDAFEYRMAADEQTVAPERILSLNASIDLGDELKVGADDYFEAMTADLRRLSADNAKLTKELDESREALKAMQASEKKRRIEASKAAVLAALEKFNADREDKVPESAVAALLKNAEDGGYAECEDAEGEWCGDEAAERDCLAECAKADMAVQKENAQKKAQKNNSVYIWDKTGAKQHKDNGGIADLLARKGIRT